MPIEIKTITEKQIAANRRNALKSTGPASPAGRAICSQNARKYQLLPHEDPQLPAQLTAHYYADLLPADKCERRLVDIMVFSERVLLNCAQLESRHTAEPRRRKGRAHAEVLREAARLLIRLPQIRDAALAAYAEALSQFEANRKQAA